MNTETTRPEVGQTLYVSTLTGRHHEMKPLVVTRVGRKWFYAAPEGASSRAERQFDLELWAENTHLGLGAVALTVEEYAERQARAAAVERLKATGYRVEGVSYDRSRCDLTTEQINAIAEIIEKGDTNDNE